MTEDKKPTAVQLAVAAIAVEYINEQFERMSGKEPMEVYSRKVDEVIRMCARRDPVVAELIHDMI